MHFEIGNSMENKSPNFEDSKKQENLKNQKPSISNGHVKRSPDLLNLFILA